MPYKKAESAIVTPEAKLCYSYLFEADDKDKYRAELVFAEGTDLSVVENAGSELYKSVWPQKKTAKTGVITSGDAVDNHEDACGLIRPWTRNKKEPQSPIHFYSVNNLKNKLTIEEARALFYDGCCVRARVTPFTYDTDGNIGVSWYLDALVFVKDGERIGNSSTSVVSDFADAMGVDLDEDLVESMLPE